MISDLHMSDPIEKEIMTARIKLLLERPFFGNLATRLIAREAPWCKTAATEGRHLFWNRQFIASLSRPKLVFLIAHEVLHVVFDHIGRRGSRDKDLFNMACDYIINYILVKERIGQMPENGLYDERFTDAMTADEVYEILKKNAVTIKMPLDEHLEASDDGSGDPQDGQEGGEGSETQVTVVGKNGPPKLTEADLQKIRNEVRAQIIQAAQQAGAGSIPAGIRRMIQELVEPKLDWRALLDAHVRSARRADYTFQRLSRRSHSGGAILPAQANAKKVEVDCFIDASGSTTQEMVTDFLSEVKGIMESFRDYRIRVCSFDTEVYNEVIITPETADEVYQYEIKGGGGTLFECIFEYLKRHGIEPNRLAILTDGEPNRSWGDANYCDTLFIIHSNPQKTAPYGLTAHYEPKKQKAA